MEGGPSPGSSPVADEILRAIRRMVQQIATHSRKLYQQTGLTVTQVLCLKAIAGSGDPEVTAAAVARQIDLRPATLTGILDRLERDGLLVRERRSRDRRKVCLTLTEKGQSRVATLPSPLHDRFLRRVEALPEAERARILETLRLLVEMLDATKVDASPILVAGDVKAPPPPA